MCRHPSFPSFGTLLSALAGPALLTLAVWGFLAGPLAGCATTGVNRGDVNLISIEQEWELGRKLESDLNRKLPLLRDSVVDGYVDRLGQRIVAQTAMARLPWEFHVVDDPAVNAFNIPGGRVYVHTGLIGAADSVNELVAVMAHEVAHGVARHGTEQLTRAYGLNLLAGVLLGEDPQAYEQILAQVAGAGAVAHYARDAEREADELGLRYMVEAGYDPQGMVTIFQELLERRRRRPSSVERFFTTHPLTESRISDTRKRISRMGNTGNLTSHDPEYQRIRRRATR